MERITRSARGGHVAGCDVPASTPPSLDADAITRRTAPRTGRVNSRAELAHTGQRSGWRPTDPAIHSRERRWSTRASPAASCSSPTDLTGARVRSGGNWVAGRTATAGTAAGRTDQPGQPLGPAGPAGASHVWLPFIPVPSGPEARPALRRTPFTPPLSRGSGAPGAPSNAGAPRSKRDTSQLCPTVPNAVNRKSRARSSVAGSLRAWRPLSPPPNFRKRRQHRGLVVRTNGAPRFLPLSLNRNPTDIRRSPRTNSAP